jgi:DNA-binding response OmpR family regulator
MAAYDDKQDTTLLPGPQVVGHTIQHDDSGAAFLIDQKMVYCTPTEYTLLLLLLQQADRPVSHEHLMLCLDGRVPTEPREHKLARNRVAHHISEVRPKIWAVDLDVVNVMRIGYILLSAPVDDAGERKEGEEVERVN